MSIKILLLQARRPSDPAKAEELISFAARAGLPLSAFVSHDLLNGPPNLAQIRQYDALMVGGSGEFYVSKGNLPQFQHTLEFFAQLADAGHPLFASCFGFHMLTVAMGGEIVHDPKNMELGTYEIMLTPEGRSDELFGALPDAFQAQLGHQDRAARLPAAAVNLAFSAVTQYQAFRLPGKPIWATQFHPELTGEENRTRYLRYLEAYSRLLSVEEREETLTRFRDSPATEALIPRFLEIIPQ